jgi:hypothetical protein
VRAWPIGRYPRVSDRLRRNATLRQKPLNSANQAIEIDWLGVELVAAGGAVAGLVGNEGGVVSEVINLESSGVDAPDRRPRHDEDYHEA